MEHVHPDDRPASWTCAGSFMTGESSGSAPSIATCILAAGRAGSSTSPGVAERDAAGRTLVAYGVLRDITERGRSEAELRDLSRRLIARRRRSERCSPASCTTT